MNKVTPAGKPERRPNHQKRVGWVVYMANRVACFLMEVLDLRTEVGQCARELSRAGIPLSLESAGGLRPLRTLSRLGGAEPSLALL